MKKYLYLSATFLALSMLFMPVINSGSIRAVESESEQIIYFHGNGCSHCAKVDAWIEENDIFNKYPIDDREIYNSGENAQYFNSVMQELGVPVTERGVPTMVFGKVYLVGDQPIIAEFETEAAKFLAGSVVEEPEISTQDDTGKDELSIWVVVSASIVDAINPCAFAVLIILLSTVSARKDKKKALFSGLSFTTAIFLSYILMGVGLYSAINAAGVTQTITRVVGVLAIILGLLNLKDFLWYGKLFKVEVPNAWRPNMKKLINSITSPAGAFSIGLIVSLFLLPCTSGPYIVVLGLLAENPLDAQALFYLVLYNLIFITPMLALTLLAFKGADIDKIEYYRQANLERMHLIAGIILIGLGVFVLFF